MSFLFNIIKGIALGAGCILPGISSGVLCVIFGIYEKIVDSVLNIFKNFKKNFLFLLPFVIGISIGIFVFGNFLKYLFSNYNNIAKYIFAGLIIGTLPALFKQANKSKYFELKNVLYTFITFFIAIFLIYLEGHIGYNNSNNNLSFLYLFIAGFLMSAGVVIPGISSTVILLCLGVYPIYLNAISLLDFKVLLPIGIGLIFGGISFLNLINYFIKKYYSQTMYSIIGFVIGSIFILLPNSFNITGIFAFLLSLFVSFKIENIK